MSHSRKVGQVLKIGCNVLCLRLCKTWTGPWAGAFRGYKNPSNSHWRICLWLFLSYCPALPCKFLLWGRRQWIQSSNVEGGRVMQPSVRPCLPTCPAGLYWEKWELLASGLWKRGCLAVVPLFITIIITNIFTNYHFAKEVSVTPWLLWGS